MSFSEHEASELQNSSTESPDNPTFFPINSWPKDIENLFQKLEIGDTDTFKFIPFTTCPLSLLLNFLFIKYQRNPAKIPKRILQRQWVIHSVPKKKHLWYYFDISQSKHLHLDGSLTPGKCQQITTPSPVFTLSGTFHHNKCYKRNVRSQGQRGYRGYEHFLFHPRHVNDPSTPQKTIGYIYDTNHSTRSPFLHTTQLQTKTTPKEEFNSKIITPKSTNPTATILNPPKPYHPVPH